MTKFTVGTVLGFFIGISIAAAPKVQDECESWKFDVAVLEAGVLTLCGGDMEKYSNVLSNMAWAAARAVKRAAGDDVNTANPTMYKWETSKMTPFQRQQHETVRDKVHLESVIMVKENEEGKRREQERRRRANDLS